MPQFDGYTMSRVLFTIEKCCASIMLFIGILLNMPMPIICRLNAVKWSNNFKVAVLNGINIYLNENYKIWRKELTKGVNELNNWTLIGRDMSIYVNLRAPMREHQFGRQKFSSWLATIITNSTHAHELHPLEGDFSLRP